MTYKKLHWCYVPLYRVIPNNHQLEKKYLWKLTQQQQRHYRATYGIGGKWLNPIKIKKNCKVNNVLFKTNSILNVRGCKAK